MKPINWNPDKNNLLYDERGVSFEDIVAYLVPYIETDEEIFLKTIIPSRKATRIYLGDKK